MLKSNRAVSLGVVCLIVITLILIAGSGLYLSTILNTSGATSVSISIGTTSIGGSTTTTPGLPGNTTTSYSIVSPSGLKFEVTLNATEIQYGNGLSAKVVLFNTLPKNLTLGVNYSTDQNIIAWNDKDFLCNASSVADLFGFGLYSGHYTALNISGAASSLQLSPPVAIPCPLDIIYPYISQAVFSPESNSFNITSNGSSGAPFNELTLEMVLNATTENCQNEPSGANGTMISNGTTSTTEEFSSICGPGTGLYGYWAAPANKTCDVQLTLDCSLQSFPVGSYTLVAQDIWNQTVFAYFRVTQSSTSTPITSDELACNSTNYTVLGQGTFSVQNGTTYTSSTLVTSTSQTTFTTTTSENETVGYVTTTTSTIPPSAWTVVWCTYVSSSNGGS